MPKKHSAIFKEDSVMEIQQDRRGKRRYPIDLPVEYKIVKNYLVVGRGSGTSLDLSSKGIAFSSTDVLKVGSYLELSISWPVLLNQSCPLKLVVSGRVVRSDGRCTAMRLDRYEFRTHAAKAAAARTGTDYSVAAQAVAARQGTVPYGR